MALGTFVPPATGGKTSTFNPVENVGKPIIAIPRKFEADFKSVKYPEPKDCVRYDVVDLMANEIKPNVFTGSGAMVSRLKEYVPGGSLNPSETEPYPLPVKIVSVTGARGQTYYSLEALEGKHLEFAHAWFARFGLAAVDAKAAEFAAATDTPADATPPWMNQDAPAIAGLGTPPATAPAPAAPVATAPVLDDAKLDAMIQGLK